MPSRAFVAFGVSAVALLVLFISAYRRPTADLTVGDGGTGSAVGAAGGGTGDARLREMTNIAKVLVKQRNDLIQQLNQKQQKLGQIACEKKGSYREATSETGGWCKKASTEGSEHHMTDEPLAAALADFFQGKSVGSFGDGPGVYKRIILKTEKVKGYDSYDGAPYVDETSEGRVQFLDLTLPQYGLPLYDWVMSLEVAEHIPGQFEAVYVDNLARHAREGVVISWAPPGQGGYSHINNKPLDYVIKIFDQLGFNYDDNASQKLRRISTFPWFQTNIIVFRRNDFSQIDKDSAHFA